eukprot:TRINITY_DN5478_c0_g1_i1.p1 TRINITY_DN5478_c0_g1~~TRINITY_DN5478_c0_g1_i1.p1  ORF type:complete len:293 (-),score=42.21 TRINITY_DN5478_c0_g1_i1:72-950(-)
MSGIDKRDAAMGFQKLLHEHGLLVRCIVTLIVLTPFVLWILHLATHKYCYMPPSTHKEYLDALQLLASVAKDLNVTLFLEYGTLLGAMRCQDLLPWSWEDMDVGLIIEDPNAIADDLQAAFRKDGRWNLTLTNSWKWHKTWSAFFTIFPINASWDDLMWSYYNHMHHDLISIDIYIWQQWKDKKFKQMGTRYHIEVDEEFFLPQPLSKCNLSHVTFNCPHHARQYLELEYEPGVIDNVVADRVCWTDLLRYGSFASLFLLSCVTVLLGHVLLTADNIRDYLQRIRRPKDVDL